MFVPDIRYVDNSSLTPSVYCKLEMSGEAAVNRYNLIIVIAFGAAVCMKYKDDPDKLVKVETVARDIVQYICSDFAECILAEGSWVGCCIPNVP